MARRGLGGGAIALIVIDAILIVVLIVLLVTHPRPLGQDGEDPQGEATESVDANDDEALEFEESPETPDPAVEVPEDARDIAEFAMPSRNIWCEIGSEEAHCFIGYHTFRPPPVDDCDSDVGPVVQLTREGATFPCVTDDIGSAPDDAPDLDYGEHTVVGDFWCSSDESGVTCRSVETGRGFTLAVGGFITF